MLLYLILFIGAVGVFGAIHMQKMKKLEREQRLRAIQKRLEEKAQEKEPTNE